MILAELIQNVPSLEAHCLRGASVDVQSFAEFSLAHRTHIVFINHLKHLLPAQTSQAAAIVMSPVLWDAHGGDFHHLGVVLCQNPYAFFAYASQVLEAHAQPKPLASVHSSAVIHPSVKIADGVTVGAYAVVEADCILESGCAIGAHCTLGVGVTVAADAFLYPHVTVYHGVQIGERNIIHSGTVLGSDGFGFAPHQNRWIKIPQTGTVILGADVEIGSNCSIDRGALGNTIIGRGTKLDNLIQIAHNVQVGEDCAFAANIAIAGSAVLGNRIQIGGNAGVLGHLSVCDDVVISSCTLVTKTIAKPGFYSGVYPIQENAEWEKNAVVLKRLSKMRDQVRELEKHLKV